MDRSKLEEVKAILDEKLGSDLDCSQDAFFIYIKVEAAGLPALMQFLQESWGMNYLADLTAVDYTEEFEIIYHLCRIPEQGQKIAVKTRVDRNRAELPSLCSLYPTADWQEREVFDLMGVVFNGHPNLMRVLLPEGFVGHPLRKDFRREG